LLKDSAILRELDGNVITVLDRDEVGSKWSVSFLSKRERGLVEIPLSCPYLKEAYRRDCTVILINRRQVIQNRYESADDH